MYRSKHKDAYQVMNGPYQSCSGRSCFPSDMPFWASTDATNARYAAMKLNLGRGMAAAGQGRFG
jgi:hypothetical protein